MSNNTETYFGLQNISGRITADNGKTFLKPYAEMTIEDFENLVVDIENWKGETLTEKNREDLILILTQ